MYATGERRRCRDPTCTPKRAHVRRNRPGGCVATVDGDRGAKNYVSEALELLASENDLHICGIFAEVHQLRFSLKAYFRNLENNDRRVIIGPYMHLLTT